MNTIVFSGIFLDNPSALTQWWTENVGPLHPRVRAYHMTIRHGPSEAEVLSLPVGLSVRLRVIGYAQDNCGQAVVVCPEGISCFQNLTRFFVKKIPHITVAVNGVPSVYSNELLSRGFIPVEGPTLEGRVGFSLENQSCDTLSRKTCFDMKDIPEQTSSAPCAEAQETLAKMEKSLGLLVKKGKMSLEEAKGILASQRSDLIDAQEEFGGGPYRVADILDERKFSAF